MARAADSASVASTNTAITASSAAGTSGRTQEVFNPATGQSTTSVALASKATVEAAIASGDAAHIEEELGDVLFAVTNLARFVKADAEAALRGTNAKFTRRFEYIEDALAAAGRTVQDASLEEMEALWNAAKAEKEHA